MENYMWLSNSTKEKTNDFSIFLEVASIVFRELFTDLEKHW